MKKNLKEIIESDGFIIINNFFSKEDIEQMRKVVQLHMETCKRRTQPNAASTVKDLSWIFYHPQILSVMRELLSTEDIMFTSHCDVHRRALSSWHKDDGTSIRAMDGGYFEQPTYDLDDCRVYKVAIYLQEQNRNSDCFRVRRKSHRFANRHQGEEVLLKTQLGDIIIFDVRLTHTGQIDVLPNFGINKPLMLVRRIVNKVFGTKTFDHWLLDIYSGIIGERFSIFFTFGANNEYTRKFSQNNMRRQLSQDPDSPIYLPTALRKTLLENKVLLAEEYFSELESLETVKN